MPEQRREGFARWLMTPLPTPRVWFVLNLFLWIITIGLWVAELVR